MKHEVNVIGMPIHKDSLDELLKETKETLALEIHLPKNKIGFGAIDLWKVQKQQRSALDLRRRLN